LLVNNTKAYEKAEVQICPFLTLALDKSKWSFSRPPFLFPGKSYQYPLNRRLVGPVKSMDFCRTEKLDPILPPVT